MAPSAGIVGGCQCRRVPCAVALADHPSVADRWKKAIGKLPD